jgi:hypothetical protein
MLEVDALEVVLGLENFPPGVPRTVDAALLLGSVKLTLEVDAFRPRTVLVGLCFSFSGGAPSHLTVDLGPPETFESVRIRLRDVRTLISSAENELDWVVSFG